MSSIFCLGARLFFFHLSLGYLFFPSVPTEVISTGREAQRSFPITFLTLQLCCLSTPPSFNSLCGFICGGRGVTACYKKTAICHSLPASAAESHLLSLHMPLLPTAPRAAVSRDCTPLRAIGRTHTVLYIQILVLLGATTTNPCFSLANTATGMTSRCRNCLSDTEDRTPPISLSWIMMMKNVFV